MSNAVMTDDWAKSVVGNWRSFQSFAWHRANELEDAENFAIFYTVNRDSDILEKSNASVIAKELAPFMEGENPDVLEERHSHFLVGYVDGYAIRVYKNGEVTEAFQKYQELLERMKDYPILDEENYSNLQYESMLDSIRQVSYGLDYELPEGWEESVYEWLSDNGLIDDNSYVKRSDVKDAFDALGYVDTE